MYVCEFPHVNNFSFETSWQIQHLLHGNWSLPEDSWWWWWWRNERQRIRNIFRSSSHGAWKIKYKNKYKRTAVRQRPKMKARMKGMKLNFKNEAKVKHKNASRIYSHEILMSGFLPTHFFMLPIFLVVDVSLFLKLKINLSIQSLPLKLLFFN